jgi:hypothetical protein
MIEYGLAQVFIARQNWKEAREHLEAALRSPTRPEKELPIVYLALAQTAKAMGDYKTLQWAVDAVVTADSMARTWVSPAARALLSPADLKR